MKSYSLMKKSISSVVVLFYSLGLLMTGCHERVVSFDFARYLGDDTTVGSETDTSDSSDDSDTFDVDDDFEGVGKITPPNPQIGDTARVELPDGSGGEGVVDKFVTTEDGQKIPWISRPTRTWGPRSDSAPVSVVRGDGSIETSDVSPRDGSLGSSINEGDANLKSGEGFGPRGLGTSLRGEIEISDERKRVKVSFASVDELERDTLAREEKLKTEFERIASSIANARKGLDDSSGAALVAHNEIVEQGLAASGVTLRAVLSYPAEVPGRVVVTALQSMKASLRYSEQVDWDTLDPLLSRYADSSDPQIQSAIDDLYDSTFKTPAEDQLGSQLREKAQQYDALRGSSSKLKNVARDLLLVADRRVTQGDHEGAKRAIKHLQPIEKALGDPKFKPMSGLTPDTEGNRRAKTDDQSKALAFENGITLFENANELDNQGLGQIADLVRENASKLFDIALGAARFSEIIDIPMNALELFSGKTLALDEGTGQIVERSISTAERSIAGAGLVLSGVGFALGGFGGAALAGAAVAGLKRVFTKKAGKELGEKAARELADDVLEKGAQQWLKRSQKFGVKSAPELKAFARVLEKIETLPQPIDVKRMRIGNDPKKIAIVGRSMGNGKDLVGVNDAAKHLREQGIELKTFKPSDQAQKSFLDELADYRDLKGDSSAFLPYEMVQKTDSYRENQTWILDLKNEGYTFLDIGNPNNLPNPSAFYDMETTLLF